MQESLSSCEAILSLAGTSTNEEEEGEDVDNIKGEPLMEEEEEAIDRLETLKTLTETVMSMIECSNKATNKRPVHSMMAPGSGGGRPQWPPVGEGVVAAAAKTAAVLTVRNKELLNNQNSIIVKEESNQKDNNREERERLDKEFREENNYENYVNYFKSKGILFPRSMWTSATAEYAETPTKSGCEKNVIYQRDNSQRMGLKLSLNLEELLLRRPSLRAYEEGYCEGGGGGVAPLPEVDEEDCEYDSERGKFNCDTLEGMEELVEQQQQEQGQGKGDKIRKSESVNFNANNVLGVEQKAALLVNKKIEYFENKLKPSKEDNRLRDAMGAGRAVKENDVIKMEKVQEKKVVGEGKKEGEGEKGRKLINILCLGSFFMTALLLYLFPLPN